MESLINVKVKFLKLLLITFWNLFLHIYHQKDSFDVSHDYFLVFIIYRKSR